jgi:hypothetical protein
MTTESDRLMIDDPTTAPSRRINPSHTRAQQDAAMMMAVLITDNRGIPATRVTASDYTDWQSALTAALNVFGENLEALAINSSGAETGHTVIWVEAPQKPTETPAVLTILGIEDERYADMYRSGRYITCVISGSEADLSSDRVAAIQDSINTELIKVNPVFDTAIDRLILVTT